MICQVLVFLFFHILHLDAVSGNQIEKNYGNNEVKVIYSPFYADGPVEKDNISSAVLSVDLKDLTNLTVCFAFMVDGLFHEAPHPDIATFWFMLAAFSRLEYFDSLSIEDGSFAPYKWIRSCFSIDFDKDNATLV